MLTVSYNRCTDSVSGTVSTWEWDKSLDWLIEGHECEQTVFMHSDMKEKDEEKLETTDLRKIYARKWVGGADIRAAKSAVVKHTAAEWDQEIKVQFEAQETEAGCTHLRLLLD